MGLVSKFLRLPPADRRLFVKVMLLVWTIRIGLWLLPFRLVRQVLARLEQHRTAVQTGEHTRVNRVVWAVTLASRYVPAATCLTQALVTKILLGRSGHRAVVRIGVARSDAGKLQFHAWVESNNKVVIGDTPSLLTEFTLLFAWDQ